MSFSNGPPTESNLVIQAQAGNEAAFEKLYTQYYDRIRVYLARRIGDNGIGCELAQEVFLKAWRGLPDLRDPSFIDHWLYRIATNEANDHQRRARHENWEYYEKRTEKT